jgi:hypothetical protein
MNENDNKCVCGEPETAGTTHRTDGPCHVAERPSVPSVAQSIEDINRVWTAMPAALCNEPSVKSLYKSALAAAQAAPATPAPAAPQAVQAQVPPEQRAWTPTPEPFGYFRKNGKLYERLHGHPNEHTLKSGWFPLWAAPSSTEARATAAEDARDQVLEKLLTTGGRMSNVLFNYSQMESLLPNKDERDGLKQLQREWDEARIALKRTTSPSQEPASGTAGTPDAEGAQQ